MASIHKKKLRSGKVVWELTHGDGKGRVRFIAGTTKAEAEGALALFKRQLALHGSSPEHLTIAEAMERYGEHLRLNRSPATARRYGRVLATFAECYLPQFHAGVKLLRDIKPHHLEEYKRRRAEGGLSSRRSARSVPRRGKKASGGSFRRVRRRRPHGQRPLRLAWQEEASPRRHQEDRELRA